MPYPIDPRTFASSIGAVEQGTDMAETEGYLRGIGLGHDSPGMVPRIKPDMGINVGGRKLVSGRSMTALRPYFAMLYKQFAESELGQQPHQKALGIAARVGIGGYLGSQEQREGENAAEVKRAADLQKERRTQAGSYASGLATYRHQMRRDEATRAARGSGEKRYPLTPELRAELKANRIFVPAGAVDVPESAVIRDLPTSVPDPIIAEMRQERLDRSREDRDNEAIMRDQTAEGVADFSLDPTRVVRDKNFRYIENKANELLAASDRRKDDGTPYSVRELQQLKKESEQFYATMDRQQMSGFRQSASTTRMHLDQFIDFFKKYESRKKPMDIRTLNKGIFDLAKEGWLGLDAQADAQALEPIAEALPLEIAKVIAGNRVPYEKEIEAAIGARRIYVDPFLKSRAALAKVESSKMLVEARIKSQMFALPFAGGKDNPYLIEVSPIMGWYEGAGASAEPSQKVNFLKAAADSIAAKRKPR